MVHIDLALPVLDIVQADRFVAILSHADNNDQNYKERHQPVLHNKIQQDKAVHLLVRLVLFDHYNRNLADIFYNVPLFQLDVGH